MFTRLLKSLDYVLLFAVFALIGIGITLIGSATHINTSSPEQAWYVQRQAMFALLNIILAM